MAKILGAVATSHSPSIGFALDKHNQDDPVWAPIFEVYEPVRRWLAEKKPDVLFVIYNDHVTSFFFDHYSQFTLGIGESYRVADEGGGPHALPAVKGHPGLAHHIAAGLVADESLATAIYENQAVAPMADETAAYLDHVHHQLAGIESLEGTARAFWSNRRPRLKKAGSQTKNARW